MWLEALCFQDVRPIHSCEHGIVPKDKLIILGLSEVKGQSSVRLVLTKFYTNCADYKDLLPSHVEHACEESVSEFKASLQ